MKWKSCKKTETRIFSLDVGEILIFPFLTPQIFRYSKFYPKNLSKKFIQKMLSMAANTYTLHDIATPPPPYPHPLLSCLHNHKKYFCLTTSIHFFTKKIITAKTAHIIFGRFTLSISCNKIVHVIIKAYKCTGNCIPCSV